MRFFVNLTNNAVTMGLADGPSSQSSGWTTKAGQSDNVQIGFHNDGTPALLAPSTPILFGCKILDEFSAVTYLMSSAAFMAPSDPTVGYYTSPLVTNTTTINAALGSTDGGVTPGNTPSISTTTCEIEWGTPCTKSQTFSVEIDNTPNRGNETEPGTSTPYPAPSLIATVTSVPLAAGDGETDDSAAIQAALTAAGEAGGGIVRLDPTKRYAISPGVVTIPANVTLQFNSGWLTGSQQVPLGTTQPAQPLAVPGQYVFLGGTGDSDTDPAYITLAGPNSAVIGGQVYDPDQLQTLTTPIVKPFAFRATGYRASIIGVNLQNPFRGIDAQGGDLLIENVSGNPLALGLRADNGFDVTRLNNIKFTPTYVAGTALAPWVLNNLTAFQFLDNDDLKASELFIYYCNIGLDLQPSTTSGRGTYNHGTYGCLVNCSFDTCLETAINDNCTSYGWFEFVGCRIEGYSVGSTFLTTASLCYLSTASKLGFTVFNGGFFNWDSPATAIKAGGGNLKVHNASFGGGTSGVAFDISGTVQVDLVGNTTFGNGHFITIDSSDSASGANTSGRAYLNATPSGSPAPLALGSSPIVTAVGGGATIPTFTNLAKGNGAGGLSDAGVAPTSLALLNAANTFTGANTFTNVKLTQSNTDAVNTGGAGSALLLNNPSATGQNVLSSIINGNLVGKWRSDASGNNVWVAGSGGSHVFTTGGDYSSSGTVRLAIYSDGGVAVGPTVADPGANNLAVQGIAWASVFSTGVGGAALHANELDLGATSTLTRNPGTGELVISTNNANITLNPASGVTDVVGNLAVSSGVTLSPATLPSTGSSGQFWSDGTHAYCWLGGAWKQLDN